MNYKTGRLPATRPTILKDLAVYALGDLPTPPTSVSPPNSPYPIDGNATYGDCTIAGVAHLIAAWNRLYGQSDPVPDDTAVIAEYFKLTGGQDTGLNEAEVLKTWQQSGLFGEKLAAYAPVPPTSLLNLHQAIAFYGGAYLGIACPQSAQEQFARGVPWTYVGEQTQDGHCIVALGFTPDGSLICATWGGLAIVTAGFCAHYLEEAWVAIPNQLVEAKKDSLGIVLPQLQADLNRV